MIPKIAEFGLTCRRKPFFCTVWTLIVSCDQLVYLWSGLRFLDPSQSHPSFLCGRTLAIHVMLVSAALGLTFSAVRECPSSDNMFVRLPSTDGAIFLNLISVPAAQRARLVLIFSAASGRLQEFFPLCPFS